MGRNLEEVLRNPCGCRRGYLSIVGQTLFCRSALASGSVPEAVKYGRLSGFGWRRIRLRETELRVRRRPSQKLRGRTP